MKKPALKLLNISTQPDGTIRLQSQLYVGRDIADYIIRPNGDLCQWDLGENSFGFYPRNDIEYVIVNDRKDMIEQAI